MRVFTVAHILDFLELQIEDFRISFAVLVFLVRFQLDSNWQSHHRTVQYGKTVFSRALNLVSVVRLPVVLFHFSDNAIVIGRVAYDGDIPVILGSRAQHGRATDIDVFNRVFQCAVFFCNCLLERIQIDDHHVNRVDTVFANGIHMGRDIASGQNAAVDFWVQGFDATVHHFRKTGVIGDFGDGNIVLFKQFSCSASGKNGNIHCSQFFGEFDKSGFVGDGYQSRLNHDECGK